MFRTDNGYSIQPIPSTSREKIEEVASLQASVFKRACPVDFFLKNTAPQSTEETLYLGAFEGDELVGFIAFMSHDFLLDGEPVLAYQIGWCATHPEHRKKGIFSNLIQQAKIVLEERGGAFLFGFPNQNSRPIFIKWLGFVEYPLHRIYFPSNPLLGRLFLREAETQKPWDTRGVWQQNNRELFRVKDATEPGKYHLIECGHDFVWGHYDEVELRGLTLDVFCVGGCTLNNPHRLKELFFGGSIKAPLIRWIVHPKNPVQRFFWSIVPGFHTEPFIVYNLQREITALDPFCVSVGLKDAF